MARLWQCGFELNSSAVGMELSTTSGSSATNSSVVRTGGYSLRINPTAGTAFVRFHVAASNQATIGYQRVYLNIASLPTATTNVVRFVDTSNTVTSSIRLTTAGKLQLMNAAGTQVGSDSATTLSAGTWYRIELANDATSTGALEAKLDGTTFASGANSGQGQWARILIGVIATSATADLYFDDWAINDNSGSVQNSWCGDGHIMHLVPNGDGDNHAWGNNSNAAGASTNYTLVDDNAPPNDTTDVVQSVTLNAEDMYTVTDSGLGGSDVVNCVMVGGRFKNNIADATTAFRFQVKKASAGTILQSASIIPNSTSFVSQAIAEPRLYPIITYTDPDGSAWTQSTLDSMQVGMKLTAAGTNRIQVTAVWASVDYTTSSVTPVSSSDTGSSAETASLTASSTGAETASGAEASSLTAAAASAETAAGAEAATLTTASTSIDTASASDTASLAADLAGSDSAVAGEAEALTVTVTSSDSATTTESEALALTGAADTGSGVDAQTLIVQVFDTDSGTANDGAVLAVNVTASDTGAGVDVTTLTAALAASETATSGEGATVEAESGDRTLSDSDTAAGTDTAATTAALASADTATATETEAVTVLLTSADTAIALDSAALTAAVDEADIATAAEAITLAAFLAAADLATGTESATVDDGSVPAGPPVASLGGTARVTNNLDGTATVLHDLTGAASVM